MHAGEKIKRAYQEAGITRHALAQRAGVAYDRMIAWEHGAVIELGSLRKLAAALGCAPVDLMNDDDLGTVLDRDDDPRAHSPYPEVEAFIDEMTRKGQLTRPQAHELATELRFSNPAHATREAAAEELRAIVRRESGAPSPKSGTVVDTRTGAALRNVRPVGGRAKKSHA